jgi:hypothetical protein
MFRGVVDGKVSFGAASRKIGTEFFAEIFAPSVGVELLDSG